MLGADVDATEVWVLVGAVTGEVGRLAMRDAEDWATSVIWLAEVELEMVVAAEGVPLPSTTSNPSPRVKGSPSVLVTMPEPVTEAMVTLLSGKVGGSALRSVMPAEAGVKLPFGVTTSTEAASRLLPVACRTKPPDMRLTVVRGTALPEESIPPLGSVEPMESCASA